MQLRFKNGVIRDWREDDKDDLVEFANNRSIWRSMADRFPHPYTRADAEWWIGHVGEKPIPTHWVIEVEGRAVGGTGVDLRDGMYAKSAEFGYWLGEPYWGRGIVTAAARVLVSEVMQRFGLISLQAHVFEWNPASMRVLEKVGLKKEGFFRCSAIKYGILVNQALYGFVDEDAV